MSENAPDLILERRAPFNYECPRCRGRTYSSVCVESLRHKEYRVCPTCHAEEVEIDAGYPCEAVLREKIKQDKIERLVYNLNNAMRWDITAHIKNRKVMQSLIESAKKGWFN